MPHSGIRYLSCDDILELHDGVIGRYGGMPGIRDQDAITSCVAQPKTAVFGEERFPTIFDKAAAYCYFIVRMHPFFDANKRTGLAAAYAFLVDHGATPGFEESAMYDAILRIACGKMEIEELADLFQRSAIG